MPKTQSNLAIVAFIPVFHRGYMEMFNSYPNAKELYVIDPDSINDGDDIEYLRKDLRKLAVSDTLSLARNVGNFNTVKILDENIMKSIDSPNYTIVLPDEDISRHISKQLKSAKVKFHSVFLRWDRRSIDNINIDTADVKATKNINDIKHMNMAIEASGHSSDIWRRVGGVIVIDSKAWKSSSNIGEPTPHSPWMEGDPRNIFNRGVGIEMSLFTHSEAMLIATAAKEGVSVSGASIYVTDYPCPACAKLIAHSGIKNLYYKEGYAVLDGAKVLDEYGVSQTKVLVADTSDTHPEAWVPYVKKKST